MKETDSAPRSKQWINLDNMLGGPGGGTAHVELQKRKDSHVVVATDYGFDIPNGAIIQGVRVEIRCKAASANRIGFNDLHLTKDAGSDTSENKGAPNGEIRWDTGLDIHHPAGGPTDDWNYGLTWEQVEDSDFGVVFKVDNFSSVTGLCKSEVDSIGVKVWHDQAGSPTGWIYADEITQSEAP